MVRQWCIFMCDNDNDVYYIWLKQRYISMHGKDIGAYLCMVKAMVHMCV